MVQRKRLSGRKLQNTELMPIKDNSILMKLGITFWKGKNACKELNKFFFAPFEREKKVVL